MSGDDLNEEELKSFIVASGTDGHVYLVHHKGCSFGTALIDDSGGPPTLDTAIRTALGHSCPEAGGA